jgi:putative (di)nucleoside polyphosphate hydrolase
MSTYRPNVAFILRRSDGRILICERSDFPGSWQFPQGGTKGGESAIDALHREVREEIGLRRRDYQVVETHGPYRYLFADGRNKKGFHGQEQTYFLGDLVEPDREIRLEDAEAGEFRDTRWILPDEFDLAWLAPMKAEVYREVFRDFFGKTLNTPSERGFPLT